MENKLTNEEIAKVFAMYYPLRAVNTYQYPASSYTNMAAIIRITEGETDIVLLLTPLDKISDEHAIEVAEIISHCRYVKYWDVLRVNHWDYIEVLGLDKKQKGNNVGGAIRLFNNGNILWDWYNNDEYNDVGLRTYYAYEHLKKLSYSVPLFFGLNHWANGKTAIELGIAIDKTTLKP